MTAGVRRLRRASVLCGLLWTPGAASAQVVERYAPPVAAGTPTAPVPPPKAASAEEDARPIGPSLRAVVLLDAASPSATRPSIPAGVQVAAGLSLPSSHAQAALRPLLGRPLSRRLIGQAREAVTRAYRGIGRPFLTVATPEQDITEGVLRLTVLEYRVGSKTVAGAGTAAEAAALTARVRLVPEGPVETPAVSDDIDWLSRYPFRSVRPVFSRGSALAATDVRLEVTEARPWSLSAGYANSGAPSTGADRYFASAQAGGLLGFGSLVSYQATASGDALFDRDRPFSAAERPRYVGHAGRLFLTPAPRLAVEAEVDMVETNQPVQAFVVQQRTYEGVFDLRAALSNLSPRLGGWGDVRMGVAAKRQETRTFFGDTEVFRSALEDYQVQLGYTLTKLDRLGRSDLDLLVHLSPGGVDPADSDVRLAAATRGRVRDARYAYVNLVLDRSTDLPRGWLWRAEALGQYSARALPSTEQAGLGQQSLVRGYTLDDGAFDRAFVLRQDVHAPAIRGAGGGLGEVRPYALLDWGVAVDAGAALTRTAASVGVGASGALARRISFDVDVARALTSAGRTKEGDLRLETRVAVRF